MDPLLSSVRPIDHSAPDTAVAVVGIQRAAYRIEADLIGYDRIPPLTESVEDVMALDLVLLGAHHDDQLIGLVGYAVEPDGVDIDRLAVDPAWFRKGIARALLAGVEDREAEAERFLVSTGAANLPAVTLYKSLGYRMLGESVIDGCAVARFVREA